MGSALGVVVFRKKKRCVQIVCASRCVFVVLCCVSSGGSVCNSRSEKRSSIIRETLADKRHTYINQNIFRMFWHF